MPESASICSSCGAQLKLGAKFCGGCGASAAMKAAEMPVQQQPLASPHSNDFREIVRSILLEGASIGEVLDILLENASEMGISKSESAQIIEEVLSEVNTTQNVGFKLFYDASSAKNGVANGNTQVFLKVENQSNKLIKSLNVYLKHPETGESINSSMISTIVRGVPKSTEIDIVLNRVGSHSIREGFVKTVSISGEEEYFKASSIVRLVAENSAATKANIISQSIQTHGGGVIDASGGSFGQKSGGKEEQVWEQIQLTKTDAVAFGAFSNSSMSSKKVANIDSDLKSDPQIISTSPVQNEHSASNKLNSTDESYNAHIAFRKIVPTDIESKEASRGLLNELLNSFCGLLRAFSAAQTVTKYALWQAGDIDFLLLHKLSLLCNVQPNEIFGVAVYEGNRNQKNLSSVNGKSTVIAIDGIYEIEVTSAGDMECSEYHSWDWLRDSSGWDFQRRSLGAEGDKVFLGENSGQTILGFDLRGNGAKIDVASVFAALKERYEHILSTSQIFENFEDSIEDEGQFEIDQQEDEDDEIGDLVYQFFSTYSFVSQFCHEEIDRSVHCYNPSNRTGDLADSLVEDLEAILGGTTPIAVCEDDKSSVHDDKGSLISWTGLASVVTREGIHHVNSSDGAVSLDGRNNFLSWDRFFREIKGGLMVRNEVPDIWIGTRDHILLKGSYVDYSSDVAAWIYYMNFVRQDLATKFAHLRMGFTG